MLEKIFNFFLPLLYFTPILRHNYMCRRQLLLPLYHRKKTGKSRAKDRKTIIYMV